MIIVLHNLIGIFPYILHLQVIYTISSGNVCVPKDLRVEREILRKKSLLPFLQIRLIYAIKGTKKLNKPTNQLLRRRTRRKSGRSHSATAEGEREALRRLDGGPPVTIDLSITQTLSLFLAMSRHHSVALALSRYPLAPLALSHCYSVPHTHFRYLWSSHGPSHFLPLFLDISGHHTVPLASSRSFSLFLAITRSLSLPPALSRYFWPSHGHSRFLTLFLAISSHHTVSFAPSRSFSLFLAIIRSLSHPPALSR